MSRNDQVTRQWILLQSLEKPGGATIDDLLRSLPEDYACHARTIRRDLDALQARFPIYTDRVGGQVRWKLVEGFSRVPAVQFSATELMALVFSRGCSAYPLHFYCFESVFEGGSLQTSAGGAFLPSAEGPKLIGRTEPGTPRFQCIFLQKCRHDSRGAFRISKLRRMPDGFDRSVGHSVICFQQ